MKGKSLLFSNKNIPSLPDDISRSQKNRIINGYNKINDHLTDKDIEGAIRDINGNPVPDGKGGTYQHYKEVDEAINGLKKERESLIKSIQNPNMPPEVEKAIKDAINEFDIYINRWNKIKEEYRK
jgi:hypothetical protein